MGRSFRFPVDPETREPSPCPISSNGELGYRRQVHSPIVLHIAICRGGDEKYPPGGAFDPSVHLYEHAVSYFKEEAAEDPHASGCSGGARPVGCFS